MFKPPGFGPIRRPLLGLLLTLALPASADAASNTTITFAGLGTAASGGDSGQATALALNFPYGMAWLADGSMVLAETTGNRVRRITTAGLMTRIAGTGSSNSAGEGVSALLAGVNKPRGIAVAPDGQTVYVAEYVGHRVRRIDTDGVITTVTGDGTAAFTGDNGAASGARVSSPAGLAVDADGNLYIADSGNNRVRRIAASPATKLVDSSMEITTVFGTGAGANSGDGGSALLAAVLAPYGLSMDPTGGYVVTSLTGQVIRRVDESGVVSTIAGTGNTCAASGYPCGDGQPALLGDLSTPAFITPDRSGGFLFADTSNNRVRRISSSGQIDTVFGTGASCSTTDICGDGGPGRSASSTNPTAVLAGPDGTIYVSGAAHRVRAVVPAPEVQGPAGGQGPAGAPGTSGSAGATGATGATGGQGPAGATGPAGAQGAPGLSGAPGAAGAAGANGSAGVPGRAGANGTTGVDGKAGSDGSAGADSTHLLALPSLVLLPSDAITSRPARRAYVRLFVSGASRVTVTIRSGGKIKRRVVRTFERVGRKRFDMGPLGRGRYVVTAALVSREPGGKLIKRSRSSDKTVLVVR